MLWRGPALGLGWRPCRPSEKTAANTATAPSPINAQPHHGRPPPDSDAVLVVVGVTVRFAALFRVVLLTVVVVLLVVPGTADAVSVLVTVLVRVGSVIVVLTVFVVSVLVAALLVVAAQTGLPARTPTAPPATNTVAAQSAERRATALATRRQIT